MDTTYDVLQPAPTRNSFLTALCILTFIGSGWGLLSGIYSYVTADKKAAEVSAQVEMMEDKMEGKEQPAFLKYVMSSVRMSADDIRKNSLVTILAKALTLAGAILMFTLRRNGYYVYIAGIVISIVGPIVLFGSGLLGIAGAVGATVVGLLFIIMYGVNTKYMVR